MEFSPETLVVHVCRTAMLSRSFHAKQIPARKRGDEVTATTTRAEPKQQISPLRCASVEMTILV